MSAEFSTKYFSQLALNNTSFPYATEDAADDAAMTTTQQWKLTSTTNVTGGVSTVTTKKPVSIKLNMTSLKQPYLPRLAEKNLLRRLNHPTHFINDYYIGSMHIGNRADRASSRLATSGDGITASLSRSSTSLTQIDRFALFPFKGDLLKASQVVSTLKTNNMSGSIKRFKTCDSPWTRSIQQLESLKPCKSSLARNKDNSSSFTAPTRSSTNIDLKSKWSLSSSNVNQQRATVIGVEHLHHPSQAQATLSTSMRLVNTECSAYLTSDRAKSNARGDQQQQQSMLTLQQSSTTSQPTQPLLQAGDLFFTSQMRKASQTDRYADTALYAFDTIWELHEWVLRRSPRLVQIQQEQLNLDKSFQIRNNAKLARKLAYLGPERIEKMTFLQLPSDELMADMLIDKQGFAIALANLYTLVEGDASMRTPQCESQENVTAATSRSASAIIVPDWLAASTLAAAHYLAVDELKLVSVDRLCMCLSERNVGQAYLVACKYKEKKLAETCEKWMELNFVPYCGASEHLKAMPLDLITKTLRSNSLFTIDEYASFKALINWTFFYLNPQVNKLPSETIVITYFSSFSKERELLARYPELKPAFFAIRLQGIAKNTFLNQMQQMNIYTDSTIVKLMLDLQHSMNNGGDMSMYEIFDKVAVRCGFLIDVERLDAERSFVSEIFSLRGFYFELIAEKMSDDASSIYEFYVQRISIHDPVISYEQNQMEAFSLRTDRFCSYSLGVHYWVDGKRCGKSSGVRDHRFGRENAKKIPSLKIELDYLPSADSDRNYNSSNDYNNEVVDSARSLTPTGGAAPVGFVGRRRPSKLYVLFSFTFPPG